MKAAHYGVFVISFLVLTLLFTRNPWAWCLPQAYYSFSVWLPWGMLSALRQEIQFFAFVTIALFLLLLFRLQFIRLLKSSSGAFGVYPTIKHQLPSSISLTFWMLRLRAKKLLTLMWSTYGKPTGMIHAGAHAPSENVVAKAEQVSCHQKSKIFGMSG